MNSRRYLYRHTLWLLLIMGSLTQVGRGQVADEYELKAVFLYNFTKFVEWPAEAAPSTSFVICILGDDPFETVIDRLTAGKTVNGRALQVRRLKEPDAIEQCQIVFVGASEKSRAARLIETTRGTPVLTVGESRDFVRMGGLFFLSTETGHVSVVIHGMATQASGLKVSAKLMTLATIFKP